MARRSTSDRLTVLVVDDERSYRDALSRELASEYDVIALPGVEEAFEILGERSDLAAVVTDLVMRGPDDGYALLEAVRLLSPRCARILVSSTSEGDWFLRNGTAHRFVRKPWKTGAVLAALWEVVG
jgi:response regulator RpfG family c-di-GMP phosphodiesterase